MTETGSPAVGERAPALALDTLGGERWELRAGRGRSVVVFFVREFT
ncbi:MAG: peroxiredoxin family protein [Gemmatimonadetes bacterium]|nr:peroxiredoxin family protein [Gemmatimonadota bacterium]